MLTVVDNIMVSIVDRLSGVKLIIIKLITIAPIIPPHAPSHVFEGLINEAKGLLPIDLPTRYAQVSVVNITSNVKNNHSIPFSNDLSSGA